MSTLNFKMLAVFCSITVSVIGQTNTSIGLEASATKDLFYYICEEDLIHSPADPSGYVGFNISEAVTENFSLEIGMLAKQYLTGFSLDTETSFEKYEYSSNGYLALQFPLRVHIEHPVLRSNFSLFTTLGYHYCISLEENQSSSGGSVRNIEYSETILTSSQSKSGYRKNYSLLEAGIGIFYEFSNDAQVFIAGALYSGFNDVININIEYQINDSPQVAAKGYNTGDYWGLRIGYKHPFKIGGPAK